MNESNEGEIVTADDVATLNRATIARAAAFARLAGSALVAVGLIATAVWLWLTIRQQQNLDEDFTMVGGVPTDGVTLAVRIDSIAAAFVYTPNAALPQWRNRPLLPRLNRRRRL